MLADLHALAVQPTFTRHPRNLAHPPQRNRPAHDLRIHGQQPAKQYPLPLTCACVRLAEEQRERPPSGMQPVPFRVDPSLQPLWPQLAPVPLQKLIDAMMATLPNLTFTLDSFSRGCVDPDTVLQVLRDVPLPADEVDVCRALSNWAEAYEADEDSAADPGAFFDVGDDILKHIDLLFVSLDDIKEVCAAAAVCMRMHFVRCACWAMCAVGILLRVPCAGAALSTAHVWHSAGGVWWSGAGVTHGYEFM